MFDENNILEIPEGFVDFLLINGEEVFHELGWSEGAEQVRAIFTTLYICEDQPEDDEAFDEILAELYNPVNDEVDYDEFVEYMYELID